VAVGSLEARLGPSTSMSKVGDRSGAQNQRAPTNQYSIYVNWFVSYGPPWAHYLGGYQDRLLGGTLGLLGLRYTAPEGVEHKGYTGVVLG
jgi:hypothetical protein